MANANQNTKLESVAVPTQDQDAPTEAEKAQEQADAKGSFEAEQKAVQLTAEEARVKAIKDEADRGMKHGLLKSEYDKLDLAGQKRAQLGDVNSDLRNQVSPQDEIDFQLLSSTNAYTISAMTGKSLDDLGKRAKELGVTLKGAAAGNGGPGTGIG